MFGNSDFYAIILAAGKGTRMGSDAPKVLLPLCGKPMIVHILDMLGEIGIMRPIVVIGTNGDQIRKTLGDRCRYAYQNEQRGSGHAVMCAREVSPDSKHVLVMCGDSPLFRKETVMSLMSEHVSQNAVGTLVSTTLDDPSGYGRIIRSASGEIAGVVEEKVADETQKAVKEINGGCYAFDAPWMRSNIDSLSENEAGEYCFTEMVDIAIAQEKRVISVPADPEEVAGVNTPAQLSAAEDILRNRGTCI